MLHSLSLPIGLATITISYSNAEIGIRIVSLSSVGSIHRLLMPLNA